MNKYQVSLEKVVNDLSFRVIYTPKDISDIYITAQDVNRPGLILTGFDDYFDPARIQFIGLTELEYFKSLNKEDFLSCLERFFSKRPAAIVVTRDLQCSKRFLSFAEKYEVPVLGSSESTSGCMSATISYLGVELAQRITRHGVLVEVYGEGVLILGDSGVGIIHTDSVVHLIGIPLFHIDNKVDLLGKLNSTHTKYTTGIDNTDTAKFNKVSDIFGRRTYKSTI